MCFQAVLRYNVPDPEPSEAFSLTVNSNTPVDDKCVTKRLTACAAYRIPGEVSNMAIIEVDLISGYIPDKDSLKQVLKDDRNVKRYEVDGSKVSFYIDELSNRDTCVTFKMIREVDVDNVKKGAVVVYDYYKPEFSINKACIQLFSRAQEYRDHINNFLQSVRRKTVFVEVKFTSSNILLCKPMKV